MQKKMNVLKWFGSRCRNLLFASCAAVLVLSACNTEAAPAAREAPPRTMAPELAEPEVEAIDQRRVEASAKVVNEQEPADVPAAPAEDDTAAAEYVAVDEVSAAAPVETMVPVSAPAPTSSCAAQPRPFGADGLVVPLNWSGDGYIVGDKDKKLMISDGDTVFLSLDVCL